MKLINKNVALLSLGLMCFSAQAVEINFNPLSILSGATTVDALFEVDDKIKIGPTAGLMNLNINTVNVSAFDLGVRGEYAFNGFKTQGVYIATKLFYSNVNVSVQDEILVCQSNSSTGTLLGGHVWRWSNGFSAKMAGGFKQTLILGDGVSCETNGTIVTTDSEQKTSEFKLAYEAGISWSF
ncbi:hypothetical protein [Marinicellulosiphila megalodicopiae]|uniref:hypothetical protein n=1 Tax=Marinicellulosiphila megalodicopiae TaxID=2724896 RepID=UPI003BAED761